MLDFVNTPLMLSRLARELAHSVNNAIGICHGNLAGIQELVPSGECDELFDDIHSSLNDLEALSRDLEIITGHVQTDKKPFDLRPWLKSVLPSLERDLNCQIAVNGNSKRLMPPVLLSPDFLLIAIRSLLRYCRGRSESVTKIAIECGFQRQVGLKGEVQEMACISVLQHPEMAAGLYLSQKARLICTKTDHYGLGLWFADAVVRMEGGFLRMPEVPDSELQLLLPLHPAYVQEKQ